MLTKVRYKMKRKLFYLFLILLPSLGLWAQERPQVLVETSKGRFIIELFNETPIHRDNFLKLVDSGAYEGVQFHRVIKDFMVQAGHLKTRGLSRELELPEDSTEATLPAELHPEIFVHVRGALAAARQPDDVNPEMRSSYSQFYIVTGKYYTDYDLREQETGRSWTYSDAQRKSYMFEGGAAHLDGTYTVFGRLLDGWGTIDKIQRVETDDNNRPLKNVIIKSMRRYTPKK